MTATTFDLSSIRTDATNYASAFRALIGVDITGLASVEYVDNAIDAIDAVGSVSPTFTGAARLTDPDAEARYLRVSPTNNYSKDFGIAGGSTPNADGTFNFVVSIGHNLRAGTRIDPTRHSFGITMEQSWFNGANTWAEWHEEFMPLNTINGVAAGSNVRMSSTIMDVDTNEILRYLTLGQFWIQRERTQSMVDGSKGTYFYVNPGRLDVRSGTEDATENFVRFALTGSGTDRVCTVSTQVAFQFSNSVGISGNFSALGSVHSFGSTAAGQTQMLLASSGRCDFRLFSGGSLDGAFHLNNTGGAPGSSYASIGHEVNDTTYQRAAILFDTRGITDPIRCLVGGAGQSSVVGLAITDTGTLKVREAVDATSFRMTGNTTQAVIPSGGVWYLDCVSGIRFRNTDAGYVTNFSVDGAGSVVAAGSISVGPITKAALLALSASATAGTYRVTDSTPAQRRVWPDGTNWRYMDDGTVVT